MTPHFLELPRQGRSASLAPASFNEVANSVDVKWTTGAIVRRRSPTLGDYDEELIVTPDAVRLERLNLGAPFLNSHSDWSLEDVLGSVVPGSARIINGHGVATIALSRAPGDADNVHKIRDGVVRAVSVGYVVHRIEIVERDGAPPIWRVVDWEPIEISAVPIPADVGAGIRSKDGKQATPQMFRCAIVPAATRAAVRTALIPAIDPSPGWSPPLWK